MYTRVRPQTAVALALAASAALVLSGCSAAADDTAGTATAAASGAPKAPASSKPKPTAAPVSRDTVDQEVGAALRAAGLDPAKGKSTAEANGKKNASLVDWTAVLAGSQADWALPRIGAQLEHLGWRTTAPLSYEKADWVLVVGSTKQSDTVTLRSGESLLTVNVTYLGAG